MDKRRRDRKRRTPNYGGRGHAVEDRDTGRASKQALGREQALRRRRAGRKTRLGAAPKQQRAKEPVAPSSTVAERQRPQRDYARMNERRAGTRMIEEPRYLTDVARGVARRVAKVAMMPLQLARAVVERLRQHDED